MNNFKDLYGSSTNHITVSSHIILEVGDINMSNPLRSHVATSDFLGLTSANGIMRRSQAADILDNARPWEAFRSASAHTQIDLEGFIQAVFGGSRPRLSNVVNGTERPPASLPNFLAGIGVKYNIRTGTDVMNMPSEEWHAIPLPHREQIARDMKRNLNDLNDRAGQNITTPPPPAPPRNDTPTPGNPGECNCGFSIGDQVQIRAGGVDVTNGGVAVEGRLYGQGGPLHGIINRIDDNWNTGSRFGLPARIRRYRIAAPCGTIVWQVMCSDLVRYNQHAIPIPEPPAPPVEPPPLPPQLPPAPTMSPPPPDPLVHPIHTDGFATQTDQEHWLGGLPTNQVIRGHHGSSRMHIDQDNPNAFRITGPIRRPAQLTGPGPQTLLEARETGSSIRRSRMVADLEWERVTDNPAKKRQMLDDDETIIQNENQFPKLLHRSTGLLPAKYSFQSNISEMENTIYVDGSPVQAKMEDRLMQVRAALGIPVHGRPDMAKAMKFYMYNRFKIPDTNMAHNRSFTHVFFTRPDLNILIPKGGANAQVRNHTEGAMLWRLNPDLFKLLTHRARCGDTDNFNLLLSNQVTSMEVVDEELSTIEAGKSWANYEMVYGDQYTGRTAGTITVGFNEVKDYSIINLLKLWITYIDNVGRGAWIPSYDLTGEGGGGWQPNDSHVFTKTLDYASSIYVVRLAEDGETVLFWTKYYGIYPINTGSSALSWELNTPVGDTPRYSIRFRYMFKRDLNPINLIEFNHNANLYDITQTEYESAFNPNYNHTHRPYVGTPFFEMKFNDPKGFPTNDLTGLGELASNSYVKLRFKVPKHQQLTDPLLFKNTMVGGNSSSMADSIANSQERQNERLRRNQEMQAQAEIMQAQVIREGRI